MASASEQLAANMNLGVFSKAKELQKRLLFTLMILGCLPHRDLCSDSGYEHGSFPGAFSGGADGLLGPLNYVLRRRR